MRRTANPIHAGSTPAPVSMSDDDLFTLMLLAVGPMPHPELPAYEDMYGGGFGTDYLSTETQEEVGKNIDYMERVTAALHKHGIADTESKRLVRLVVERQRRAAWDRKPKPWQN
jgi:hypothetical protein